MQFKFNWPIKLQYFLRIHIIGGTRSGASDLRCLLPHPTHVKRGVSMTGPERSSTHWIIFRRKLTTKLVSSSRMVTCKLYPLRLLPHPHRKQTQVAQMRDRKRRRDNRCDILHGWDKWGLKCVCRKFNMRVVFKSGWILHSMFTKVKETLPLGMQSDVVYRIPSSFGQVYVSISNLYHNNTVN